MKILLVAVNAKYIHSNLAVYCLKSYAASKGCAVEIAEYTINQQPGDVLRDLYEQKVDVVAFSCYIWNIDFIKGIIKDYKKVRPQSEIWLGGPEVSFRGAELLRDLPEVRGVMVGEGEETFAKLVSAYEDCIRKELTWNSIPDIVVRQCNGEILTTEQSLPLDFSRLPFPYGDGSVTVEKTLINGEVAWNTSLNSFENRIVYYESSRGCPFSCAYCLSSIDKRVRFRDMELVKKELAFFLEQQVPQVKFIDRTFNVNAPRTMELLQFIKDNDNGITNFHCEIAAELLTKEQIELLNSLRPGLVQLEIGVQSTNMDTLHAVNRRTELSRLKQTVAAVRKKNNVHIHLDLIAGLPKEDLKSFQTSFNEVYRMNPHQLQLGFLKVLSGAPMEQMTAENDIVYQSAPPYEVLSTRWLSFEDSILLKKVEELVEVYYNSGQFVYSMMYLQHIFAEPFVLFEKLAKFYDQQNLAGMKLSRNKRYELLWEFAKTKTEENSKKESWNQEENTLQIIEEILFYDYCLREKPKNRPVFGRYSQLDKRALKEIYLSFGVKREDEGMHDIEQFSFEPVATAESGKKNGESCAILFSYKKRETMYGGATTRLCCGTLADKTGSDNNLRK